MKSLSALYNNCKDGVKPGVFILNEEDDKVYFVCECAQESSEMQAVNLDDGNVIGYTNDVDGDFDSVQEHEVKELLGAVSLDGWMIISRKEAIEATGRRVNLDIIGEDR